MNKDNAHLYLPLVEALRDGELDININGVWMPCLTPLFDAEPDRYRRRPKRCTVPLEQGDLPFPCAVRLSMDAPWHIVMSSDLLTIYIHGYGVRSFGQLQEDGWLYSATPQDPKSWRRCEKEVEV